MWQIEAPNVEFNSEELYEMENYQAYAHASMIIKHSALSDRVQARLVEYKWGVEIQAALGIGSVKSYDDYISRMTKHYGHKMSFLQEVDHAA